VTLLALLAAGLVWAPGLEDSAREAAQRSPTLAALLERVEASPVVALEVATEPPGPRVRASSRLSVRLGQVAGGGTCVDQVSGAVLLPPIRSDEWAVLLGHELFHVVVAASVVGAPRGHGSDELDAQRTERRIRGELARARRRRRRREDEVESDEGDAEFAAYTAEGCHGRR
jgi:hypothetical protein